MLPLSDSSGGVRALQQYASNSNMLSSLNDSVRLLTTSVDKLNTAVIDLVDINEDVVDEENKSTNSGRKTKRHRRKKLSPGLQYKKDRDISWFRHPDKHDENKSDYNNIEKDRDKEGFRVPFTSFDTPENQRDLLLLGRAMQSTFEGVRNIFGRLAGSLEIIATSATGRGLGSLGVGALATFGVASLAANAAEAIGSGVHQGAEGRQRLDAQPPVNQRLTPEGERVRPNVNPGAASIPRVSPEEQQRNLQEMQQEQERDRQDRLERQLRPYQSNSSYQDLNSPIPESIDGLIDTITKRIEKDIPNNPKNDAVAAVGQNYNLSPYYISDISPQDLETKTMGPLLAQAGVAAVGEGSAIVGGAAGMQREERNRDAERGAQSILDRLLPRIPGIYGVFGRTPSEPVSTEEWNRQGRAAAERNSLVPAPVAPPSTPTGITSPTEVPIPMAPIDVPRIAEPTATPTPAAPSNPPAVSQPTPVPTPAQPAITSRPATAADRPDLVLRPPVAQSPAVPSPQAQVIPSVPPAPSTNTPVPTAPAPRPVPTPNRQPVIVQQNLSPPPYIPPQINMPQAIGGANRGRGMGFVPIPPAPPSPTARTPSYPNRSF